MASQLHKGMIATILRTTSFVRLYWMTITLIILAAITGLSLWPLDQLPTVPGSDKTHHFIAYAALIIPVVLRKPKYWPLICSSFVFWGGAIELLQPFVNRYGEWLDIIANTFGLAFGLMAAMLINRFER